MWNKWITKRSWVAAVAALALLGFGRPSHAALSVVGPVDPGHGFPATYQDGVPLTLELCLPDANELSLGTCLILPADIPDPAVPVSFPSNFPAEAFYWAADALIFTPAGGALPRGGNAILFLGLQAGFVNGAPVDGEQVTVGTVQIRVDVPTAGTYTVTHPFGVETFNVTAPGPRAINSTVDVGISTPGVFTTALGTAIGPFLRASASAGGPPLAPLDLFPGSGNLYIADPNVLTPVTGGPVGNIFRIQGPDIGGPGVNSVQTDLFSLVGRVSAAAPPPATNFAPVAANDTATTAGGPVTIPVLANDTDPDGTLNPATVAISSPALNGTAVANGDGTVTYTPSPGFLGNDQFAYTVRDNLAAVSNAAIVNVTVAPPPNAPPAAANDTATTTANTPVTINVLANDSDFDGTLNPASVAIVTPPVGGTALANPVTGAVTYTPNPGFQGPDGFTYTVQDNLGAVSNAATVAVNVTGDTISVQLAQFTFAQVRGKRTVRAAQRAGTWMVQGACSGPGSTLTFRVGPDFTGAVLGTAKVAPNGSFRYVRTNSKVLPDATKMISIQSSGGAALLNVPVIVR